MNGSIEAKFPNLSKENYRKTSPETTDYNCIAWAAGIMDSWWWPDQQYLYYWPDDVPRVETIKAFVNAFRNLSYEECDSGGYEDGFEKIAIFAKDGKPTHAARQINSTFWTSKLGCYFDIEHHINGVSGDIYGSIAVFMIRAKIKKQIQFSK